MSNYQKQRVYHAVNNSQDGKPLTKFFDGAYNLRTDVTTKIELYARPSVGDLLNYLLANRIQQVDEKSDLSELADDLEYAAKQLAVAAQAARALT